MNSKKCLIVGLDGFDVDVLVNLAVFYESAGFDVSASRCIKNCDLLVVLRGHEDSEIEPANYSECHIYDYVASGTYKLANKMHGCKNILVINPRGQVDSDVTASVLKSFHPVIPALWTGPECGSRSRVGHIGNKKPGMENDVWFAQLLDGALSGNIQVWGGGWVGAKEGFVGNGPTTLHETQKIYRRLHAAVGGMYEFQREKTISGRMWQAPLNGCALISERVVMATGIPGVIQVESLNMDAYERAGEKSGDKLKEDASEFWTDSTQNLARLLGYSNWSPKNIKINYFKHVYLRHAAKQFRMV